MDADKNAAFWDNLPDDLKPKDGTESIEDWLQQIFPDGPDDTVEWLCYCLSPHQMSILFQMIALNASDTAEDKQGAYRQRQQRVYAAMLKSDSPEVLTEQLASAKKFVDEHQIW